LNDFDDVHPAGTSLNDLFTIQPFDYYTKSMEEMRIDDFLQQDKLVGSELYIIRPTIAPTTSEEFEVMIRMTLNEGEQYEMISSPILLID